MTDCKRLIAETVRVGIFLCVFSGEFGSSFGVRASFCMLEWNLRSLISIVMMEKLRFVKDSVKRLEIAATNVVDVAVDSDKRVDCHRKSDALFLDCYLRFMGAGGDQLSWRTHSFKDVKDN